MCLTIYDVPVVKKSETDMEFYKVLAIKDDGKYYSPYMNKEAELGVLHQDPDLENFMIAKYSFWLEVTHGGFHLFKDEYYARCEADYLNQVITEGSDVKEYVVVKAIVPEGTTYVEGTYLAETESVVVKKVRYKEI